MIYKKNAFKSHSKSYSVSTSIKSSNCLHLSNAKALPETFQWQSRNLMMAVRRREVRFIEVLEAIPLVSPPLSPSWLPLIRHFDHSNAVKLQYMAQMAHKSSHHDFIETPLVLVIWIDFKFQIISEDNEIQSFNVNPTFPLCYSSPLKLSWFFPGRHYSCFYIFFPPAYVAKVKHRELRQFGTEIIWMQPELEINANNTLRVDDYQN